MKKSLDFELSGNFVKDLESGKRLACGWFAGLGTIWCCEVCIFAHSVFYCPYINSFRKVGGQVSRFPDTQPKCQGRKTLYLQL